MTQLKRRSRTGTLDTAHIVELPDEVLMGLLTTHLGRLAATRGEVLDFRERQRVTVYCYELAMEARTRGTQLRLI